MMRRNVWQCKSGKWTRDFKVTDHDNLTEFLEANNFRTRPLLVVGEDTDTSVEVFPSAGEDQFPALVAAGKLEEFVVADLPSLIHVLPGLAAAAMSQEIQALTETLERTELRPRPDHFGSRIQGRRNPPAVCC